MDISMCTNRYCPSKENCLRFSGTPSEFWQTYSDFEVPQGEDKCGYFWDMVKYLGKDDEKSK